LKRIIKRRIKSLSADDPVFTYHGRVYGDSSVKGFMKRTCKKAGVTYGDRPTDVKGNRLGVVFHSFRHTFITRLIRQGYSDEVIRRITGHKDLSAYRNYVHLEAVDLMEVVRNRINLYTNLDKPANSNAL
jgi:integrase